MEKWIIVVQNDHYYTDETIVGSNFHNAAIFENKTKKEVEKIGKELYKNCRCFWRVGDYDKELILYEERIYVDPSTKKYLWGKYLDIIEALKLAQLGVTICYIYKNEKWFIKDSKMPDYIDTDVIINAKWRVVEPAK